MDISENYHTITILEAIHSIESRNYRLPAIQRKFVWQPAQILALFDSIFQGYPINTFMVWKVASNKVKSDFKFYDFLKSYCERFAEDNPISNTRGSEDFYAIIDGQQRLTSIYIGLKGTYAKKLPRLHWPPSRDDNVLPPKTLFIDLAAPCPKANATQMKYNLKFLTCNEANSENKSGQFCWFEVGRILELDDIEGHLDKIHKSIKPILKELNLEDNEYAEETLCRMYSALRVEPTLHYYLEKKQDIDYVLDVFLRTNSGGTPLSFSDLLMSIAIANWKGDARADIDTLVGDVWQSSDMRFSINRDWVLKTCLALVDADMKFKVENFTSDCVLLIESQWDAIRNCIRETFRLLNNMGFVDQALRAKNAVIPIAYYLYKKIFNGKKLYEEINRDKLGLHTERTIIGKWLNMVILKRTFGGQSDAILGKMRKIISDNISSGLFPLSEIISGLQGTTKDLRFDMQYVETLLHLHKDSPDCRSLLMLLFPEINVNFQYHIDHLHPKDSFSAEELKKQDFLLNNKELFDFYSNSENWDTVPNLQLLNDSQNESKKKRPLQEWIDDANNGFRKEDLLIGPEVNLSFENFSQFINARKEAITKRLKANVAMSDTPVVFSEEDEDLQE